MDYVIQGQNFTNTTFSFDLIFVYISFVYLSPKKRIGVETIFT